MQSIKRLNRLLKSHDLDTNATYPQKQTFQTDLAQKTSFLWVSA